MCVYRGLNASFGGGGYIIGNIDVALERWWAGCGFFGFGRGFLRDVGVGG